MILIITLYTHNKTLVTSPIKTLIRNGEKNADEITIITERFYGGTDLSLCGFVIEAVNSMGTCAVQMLSSSVTENGLELYWKITSDFTAVSGPLKITLKAVSSDNEVIILFDGGEIQVCGENTEDLLPTDVKEQLLSQIEASIASIDDIATQAVNEKTQAFVDNFDPTPIVESCIPDNLVTSDEVREIVVLTSEEYDDIAVPSSDTLYIVM